ncbi:hypothetical protein PAPYR_4590 [Paratrimastix pyriformis]|uniref:Uncharacterized protein n=1 Tax=Paratrimastix pyriformis TaxID=342808 RepID=A0ABQ8UPS3_9EUKA|nr:hypothetical protein PAPYR_4590 [Paratrimastix pyriformis]
MSVHLPLFAFFFPCPSRNFLATAAWLQAPVDDHLLVARPPPLLAAPAPRIGADQYLVRVGTEVVGLAPLMGYDFANGAGRLPGLWDEEAYGRAFTALPPTPVVLADTRVMATVLGLPCTVDLRLVGTVGLEVATAIDMRTRSARVSLRPSLTSRLAATVAMQVPAMEAGFSLDGTLVEATLEPLRQRRVPETPRAAGIFPDFTLCTRLDLRSSAHTFAATQTFRLQLQPVCAPCGSFCLQCNLTWCCEGTRFWERYNTSTPIDHALAGECLPARVVVTPTVTATAPGLAVGRQVGPGAVALRWRLPQSSLAAAVSALLNTAWYDVTLGQHEGHPDLHTARLTAAALNHWASDLVLPAFPPTSPQGTVSAVITPRQLFPRLGGTGLTPVRVGATGLEMPMAEELVVVVGATVDAVEVRVRASPLVARMAVALGTTSGAADLLSWLPLEAADLPADGLLRFQGLNMTGISTAYLSLQLIGYRGSSFQSRVYPIPLTTTTTATLDADATATAAAAVAADQTAPGVVYLNDGAPVGLWQVPTDAQALSSMTSYTFHLSLVETGSGLRSLSAGLSTAAPLGTWPEVTDGWVQVQSWNATPAVLAWQGTYTLTGLHLVDGGRYYCKIYYCKIHVEDHAGHVTEGTSDGFLVDGTNPALPGPLAIRAPATALASASRLTVTWPQPRSRVPLRSLHLGVGPTCAAATATLPLARALALPGPDMLFTSAVRGAQNPTAARLLPAPWALATTPDPLGNVTVAAATVSGLGLVTGQSYYAALRLVALSGREGLACAGPYLIDTIPPVAGPVRVTSAQTHDSGTRYTQANRAAIVLEWDECTDIDGSGVARYEAAIGRAPNATDVLMWVGVGGSGARGASLEGLALEVGFEYWVTLRCGPDLDHHHPAPLVITPESPRLGPSSLRFAALADSTSLPTMSPLLPSRPDLLLTYQTNTTHARLHWEVTTNDSAVARVTGSLGLDCNATVGWPLTAVLPQWDYSGREAAHWLSDAVIPLPAGLPVGTPIYATICLTSRAGGQTCGCTASPLLLDPTSPVLTRLPVVWQAGDDESGLVQVVVELVNVEDEETAVARLVINGSALAAASSSTPQELLLPNLPHDLPTGHYRLRLTATNGAQLVGSLMSTSRLWLDLGDHPVGELPAYFQFTAPNGTLVSQAEYALVNATFAQLGQVVHTSDPWVTPDVTGWAPLGLPGSLLRLESLPTGGCSAVLVRTWSWAHTAIVAPSSVFCVDLGAPELAISAASAVANTTDSLVVTWRAHAPSGIRNVSLALGSIPGAHDILPETAPSTVTPADTPTSPDFDLGEDGVRVAIPLDMETGRVYYPKVTVTTWANRTYHLVGQGVLVDATAPEAAQMLDLRQGPAGARGLWMPTIDEVRAGLIVMRPAEILWDPSHNFLVGLGHSNSRTMCPPLDTRLTDCLAHFGPFIHFLVSVIP